MQTPVPLISIMIMNVAHVQIKHEHFFTDMYTEHRIRKLKIARASAPKRYRWKLNTNLKKKKHTCTHVHVILSKQFHIARLNMRSMECICDPSSAQHANAMFKCFNHPDIPRCCHHQCGWTAQLPGPLSPCTAHNTSGAAV